MRLPVITKLLERRARAKLRAINKGYKKLSHDKKLDFPVQLMDVLSSTKLSDSDLPIQFLCKDDFNIELSVRQYLGSKFVPELNKAILYSIGSNTPLVYPLPKKWRDTLITQGVDISHFKSDLSWRYQGFRSWAKGVLYGLKSFYFLFSNTPDLKKYVYFDNMNINCLSKDINKKNIINWYLQYPDKVKDIDTIAHSVKNQPDFNLNTIKIVYIDGLPNINGMKLVQYGVFAIYASIFSALCFIFKPTYGFFLEDILKLKRFDLANNDDLAKDYLFNTTGGLYRPIWTYIAEKKGARLLFYFYSTNNEFFKTEAGYPIQHPWHLLNWPYYLVWDNYQADFISRHNKHNPKIEEVGQIWFSSIGESTPIPENSIAVFDSTTFRPVMHAINGVWMEYRTYKNASNFLDDIQSVLGEKNISMVHKNKRSNSALHKKYIRKIKTLNQESNYIEINPDYDALSVIQKTKACISMPFTSTAVLAKEEGRPSVYYDPTDIIQKNDRAAHGIPILNGIGELKVWIESIKNNIDYE